MTVLAMGGQSLPPDTATRLSEFTELLGTAITNANMRAEAERLAEEQAALRRVATLIARDAPTEQVLVRVGEEVNRLLQTDGAVIHRFGPDGYATIVGASGNASQIGSHWRLEGESAAAAVYRTRASVRCGDLGDASGPAAREVRRLGLGGVVASPIVVNGHLWGAIVAATRHAVTLPPWAEAQLTEFAGLVAIAISNLQARSESRRLADEQAALRRVATLLAREPPAADLLARVAKEIGLVLSARIVIITRHAPGEETKEIGSWRASRSPCETAADVHDSASRSCVAGPIMVHGSPWGAVLAVGSVGAPLPRDARSCISHFTELLATSIVNIQARSDLAASRARVVLAADGERRRLVRDLHDGAQQRLVHTIITINRARRALSQGAPGTAALVDEALRHAQTATLELRELADGILPAALTRGGIRGGAGALASRMPVPIEVDATAERFSAAVESTAYFVVAEALTNVAKHARATQAVVRVRVQAGVLHVAVSDDGVGGARSDGSGLTGIRDRLSVVHGTLRVDSQPGRGTSVAALIPLECPATAASCSS